MTRRSVLTLLLAAVVVAVVSGQTGKTSPADTIIALERGALDRWGRGDPGGYLELYARDATYFDPMREQRVDGLEALKKILEPIKGQVKVDRYEMIAPHVAGEGTIRVFTYNLVSHGRSPDGAARVARWNVTAVYRQEEGRWKIAHHHFSFTKPELKAPGVP